MQGVDLRCRVQGVGCKLECRNCQFSQFGTGTSMSRLVNALGFRVWGLGFGVWGLGFTDPRGHGGHR